MRSTLRPLAEAKGLELRVHVPADLPLARGDAGRLTQCLMNLAGNSLKFTKEGHVAISVEPKGESLVSRVIDAGIGIPPDKIGSLFTEFKIALSGDDQKAREAVATAYLAKPYSPRDLLALIRSLAPEG